MELAWLFALLPPVMGHVLYGLPAGAGDAGESCVRLHNGDDFSPQDEPPHPDRLAGVRGVAGEGWTPLAVRGDRERGVSVDTSGFILRPAWVVVETPRTFIELPPGKFEAYLRHEGLGEVLAARAAGGVRDQPGREIYSKYIKVALPDADGGLRFLTSAVGLPVEIVPVTPGPLRAGDRISVRVLCAGRPAPDLQIRVSHREPGKTEPVEDNTGRTGEDGEFRFTAQQPGYWRLHTISMSSIHRDGADWESLWASLTFRVGRA